MQPGRSVPRLNLLEWILIGNPAGAEKAFYMVYRDGQPVARAGFKVHRARDYEALHFGFFEALPGTEAEVRALMDEGQKLAPHLPIRGPHQFALEDPYTGLLVDGFDLPPQFLMSYNPPYYRELLTSAGLQKVMDLVTYQITPETVRYTLVNRSAQRARERGIEVRHQPGGLRARVRTIVDVFNSALANNWGFERIEGELFEQFVLFAGLFLKSEHVYFAVREGQTLGCLVVLPNYNPMLERSGGRFNWKLLSSYFKRDSWVDSYRGYALGVIPEARADMVTSALINAILEAGKNHPWKEIELSWILESNEPMRALARALGGQPSKSYRILERPAP